MPKVSSFDLSNFLLGLAWLGELNREQIRALWFPGLSESTTEKRLADLRKDGLIQARNWSLRIDDKTVPQLARWGLTDQGHDQVRRLDSYPLKPVKPRRRQLLQHDARTTEIVVKFIAWARPRGLSSLCVLHEVRLDPSAPRPVCDALVIMQFGGPALGGHLVPWSRDPAIDDEERRRFAIESDNDTEAAAVIRGKGVAYRRMREDPEWLAWWEERYGPPPTAIWVAPTLERCRVIHRQWLDAWPNGSWLITDDAGLAVNHWRVYERNRLQRHSRLTFVPDPEPEPAPAPAPALPAPAPAALPAPAPAPVQQPAQAAAPTPSPAPLAAVPAPKPVPAPAPQAAPPPVPSPAPAPRPAPPPSGPVELPDWPRVVWTPPPPAPTWRERVGRFGAALVIVGVAALLLVAVLRAADMCDVAYARPGAALLAALPGESAEPAISLRPGEWLARGCEPREEGLDVWWRVRRLPWLESGWVFAGQLEARGE